MVSKKYLIVGLSAGLALFGFCALVFYAGYGSGKIDNRVEHHTSEYASGTQSRLAQACPDTKSEGFYNCVAEVVLATNEDQRDEDDLAAQSEMARWAFWMLGITTLTTIITGTGVYFVAQTLNATSETLTEMRASNQIMRDEQRAWMTYDRELGCTLHVNEQSMRLEYNGKMMNWGKSPAFSVRTQLKVITCDFFNYHGQLNEFTNDLISKAEKIQTKVSIFPHETPEYSKILSATRMESVKEYLFLLVGISYRLRNSSDSELGFDVRLYEIIENDGSSEGIDSSHLLIEYRQERQTS